MKYYSKLYALLPVFAVSFFLLLMFSHLFYNANNFIYFDNGDALKNYFHFLMYAEYGNSFYLNEVNYPFGEHIVFLDNQPLIAFIVNKLGLSNFSIGIINTLPFISLVFTSSLLFFIQRFLGLPLFLNTASSFIITLLSPQILRFESHHALAYSFVIPLCILLLLYTHKSKLYFIGVGFLCLFISFIHLYYLLIMLVFVMAYALIILINRKKISYFILALLSVISPFIIVKYILKITDYVIDRPSVPSGGTAYRSTFEGVFIPQNGFLSSFFNNVLNFKAQNPESIAYVGKLGLPILIFMLLLIGIRLLKNRKTITLYHNVYLFELCWAACLVWLFAMQFPLKFIIDFIGEYFDAIKQFRSLGRLGWVFFYVFSILISFKIFHLTNYLSKKLSFKIASIISIIAFSIWFSDIFNQFNNLKNAYQHHSSNIFKEKNSKLEKTIDFSKYQASLALPLFHVGAEFRSYEGSSASIKEVFKLAYFYQLPYISTYSSRVSKNQFLSIENAINHTDLKFFNKNNKPILIVADVNLITNKDSLFIEKSNYLYHINNIYFYQYNFVN